MGDELENVFEDESVADNGDNSEDVNNVEDVVYEDEVIEDSESVQDVEDESVEDESVEDGIVEDETVEDETVENETESVFGYEDIEQFISLYSDTAVASADGFESLQSQLYDLNVETTQLYEKFCDYSEMNIALGVSQLFLNGIICGCFLALHFWHRMRG